MEKADEYKGSSLSGRDSAVTAVFFLSGFPALLYQVAWQRSLFTIYGVNIESITVVVAAFMLGLGLGSLLGGWASKDNRLPPLLCFGVAELTIGLFGFFSLGLFDRVGAFTYGAGPLKTGLLTFGMALLPTLMMGATLPLLVAYLVRQYPNVGRSVGVLYSFNTLGSAFACIAAAFFLMKSLGMQGVVMTAACMNLIVSACAIVLYLRGRKRPHEVSRAMPEQTGEYRPADVAIPFKLAVPLVFLSGYISLSYEIVWIRVYSIGMVGRAYVFPLVLGVYLAGIAWGALESRRFCKDDVCSTSPVHTRALLVFVLLANTMGFLLVPFAARAFEHGLPVVAILMLLPAAGFLGATLPLVCHMAVSPDHRAGERLSYLYLSNILGSTLGTCLTGLVLMDIMPIRGIALLLALLGLAMGALLIMPARLGRRLSAASVLGVALVAVIFMAFGGGLYDRVYERLVFRKHYDGKRFADIVEGRSGVVTVSGNRTIYGDGIYDGRFSTDLVDDTNYIVRAYGMNAFHPAPKEVLMIGLSSGSWAQVIANNPDVKKLTIVEINPGYLGLIQKYPMVKSVLDNPKVEIIIDDGRRWLARNPDRRFDFVMMNTTWHWRAFATNLLSVEFLNMVKTHLNKGGVFMYNTTSSPEAQRTGATVYRDTYLLLNFLVVSDSHMNVDKERLRSTLLNYRIDGKPVFDMSRPKDSARFSEVMGIFDNRDKDVPWDVTFEGRAHILERTKGCRVMTDDNMGAEWRLGAL